MGGTMKASHIRCFYIFFGLIFILFSVQFNLKAAATHKNGSKNKSLDQKLCNPPTLKHYCLLALKNRQNFSTSLPSDIELPIRAFQNIHKKEFTADDLKTAFNFCAPHLLKEKTAHINERITKKLLNEIPSFETQTTSAHVPADISLFESVFWILNTHCDNDINVGLIEISDYTICKKRKVHLALLLNVGANINYKYDPSTIPNHHRLTTPLLRATIQKRLSCTEFFLKHKANLNEKNGHGYTAYTLAKDWPDKSFAQLLLAHGALDIPLDTGDNQKAQEGFGGPCYCTLY